MRNKEKRLWTEKTYTIYRSLRRLMSIENLRHDIWKNTGTMPGAACGISRELYAFSQHQQRCCCCCCCCCRLDKRTTQTVTTHKLIDNNSSSPTVTGSEKSDLVKRLRANDRERDRMHDLNSALARLRAVLPTGNGFTRRRSAAMSKIATLRTAQNYIRVLSSVLTDLELREDTGSDVIAGACRNQLSSSGDITCRQQDGFFQQPEVVSDDVIRGRPTTLSDYPVRQQMSLLDQHDANLYSSHTMVYVAL